MTEPKRLGRQRGRRRSWSRTNPLPGDGSEEGNWYSCWSCGMHCNDRTDELDDGASRVHTTYEDFVLENLGPQGVAKALGGQEGDSVTPVLGGILHVMVASRIDSNGDNQPVVHYHQILDTKGCPNDGNLNWRGDY